MNRAYSRAGIIARLFNQPMAVLPQTAAIVLGAVGPRLDVQQLFVATEGRAMALPELKQLAADERAKIEARSSTDRVAKSYPADRLMFVHQGVAHVGVRGETVAENGIGPMSGFTGYDGIVASVQSADADPKVRGILLDIDSGGGEVSGLFEAVAILMARRGSKPMRAMIRGVGASAAYALAACADEITLHDLGIAGSIGCLSMHADFSGSLEQDGIKVTLFTSGEHKADGNPFEPLPAEVVARVQAMVDTSAERFITHVAGARGLKADAVRAQQANIFMGEEAVAAGLVDKVMGWQDSMDEFEAAVNGSSNRSAGAAPTGVSAKGRPMDPNAQSPAAEGQPEFTQAQLDAAATTARAEGVAAGAKAEQERFSALAALDSGSKISAELSAAITAGTSAGDFAIAQLGANKAKLGAAATALAAEAAPAAELPAGGAAAAAATANGAKPNRGAAYAARKAGQAKA